MAEREIVVGTANRDKLRELRRLLSPLRIKVISIGDFGKVPRVVENGKTFEENASKKAKVYSKLSKKLTLADDSGLCVPALKGRPGVYSARFAGRGCTYEDNNRKLLRLLSNRPSGKRGAFFHCSIALFRKGKKVRSFQGKCHGRVASAPAGTNGFGYDPVFIPRGRNQTFAEMKPREKNRISHRGRALRSVKQFLSRQLKAGSKIRSTLFG